MFKQTNKMLFSFILMMSTLLVISSTNWLSIWMGMEINLMAFIPLIFKKKDSHSSESCMIYFMVQAFSSIILLFSATMTPKQTLSLQLIPNLMLVVSLMMKLGIPPFHSWFVEAMSKMEWMPCLLLMTLQKIAPMMVFFYLNWNPLLSFTTAITATIMAINQTSLRKLMAMSSISHMGWMLSCMMNTNTWLIYFTMYSMMSTLLIFFLKSNNILYLNQMFKMNSMSSKLILSTLLMSMGGLPPFMGFIPKWMAIQIMVMNDNLLLAIGMVLTSLITLFYYLRMISTMMLSFSMKSKWTLVTTKSSNSCIMALNLILPLMAYMLY